MSKFERPTTGAIAGITAFFLYVVSIILLVLVYVFDGAETDATGEGATHLARHAESIVAIRGVGLYLLGGASILALISYIDCIDKDKGAPLEKKKQ